MQLRSAPVLNKDPACDSTLQNENSESSKSYRRRLAPNSIIHLLNKFKIGGREVSVLTSSCPVLSCDFNRNAIPCMPPTAPPASLCSMSVINSLVSRQAGSSGVHSDLIQLISDQASASASGGSIIQRDFP